MVPRSFFEMGRIKTQKVKSAAQDIYAKFGDKFGSDFEKNKQVVMSVAEIRSKKLRNILAGCLTRKVKQRS